MPIKGAWDSAGEGKDGTRLYKSIKTEWTWPMRYGSLLLQLESAGRTMMDPALTEYLAS